MKAILIFFLILNVADAEIVSWFTEDITHLCAKMSYHSVCTSDCEGGFHFDHFIIQDSMKKFGSHYWTRCGKGPSCGDSFFIDKKIVRCEPFLEAIRTKNKECGHCLKVKAEFGK